MQFLYKLFVPDKILVNNLPLFISKRDKKNLKKIVNYMRKQLFIRKIKKILGLKLKKRS